MDDKSAARALGDMLRWSADFHTDYEHSGYVMEPDDKAHYEEELENAKRVLDWLQRERS